jgi:hypothetical protein
MSYNIDGHSFYSKAEADRYLALKRMKFKGEIQDFKVVIEPYVLVKAYNKCTTCGKLSSLTVCELCGSKTYSSSGIVYRPNFQVYDNAGKMVIEDVMKSHKLSHEWNMKKILYDQLYTTPIRIIVEEKAYHKTERGWVRHETT